MRPAHAEACVVRAAAHAALDQQVQAPRASDHPPVFAITSTLPSCTTISPALIYCPSCPCPHPSIWCRRAPPPPPLQIPGDPKLLVSQPPPEELASFSLTTLEKVCAHLLRLPSLLGCKCWHLHCVCAHARAGAFVCVSVFVCVGACACAYKRLRMPAACAPAG